MRWKDSFTWLLPLILLPALAHGEIELAPYAGFRAGGEFDIRNNEDNTSSRMEFKDTPSLGLVLNFDLDESGKQGELYFARQDTTAHTADGLLTPDSSAVDVVIYQLQFGGLYFPGGKTTGGFVSGVLGVTRLDPKPSGLRNHHRASISLGGGFKIPINNALLLRLDLRGIYTALDTGGSVFCSGGCTARFESSGYVQVEAGAGLVLRF